MARFFPEDFLADVDERRAISASGQSNAPGSASGHNPVAVTTARPAASGQPDARGRQLARSPSECSSERGHAARKTSGTGEDSDRVDSPARSLTSSKDGRAVQHFKFAYDGVAHLRCKTCNIQCQDGSPIRQAGV